MTLKQWKPRANWRQILVFVLLAVIATGAEYRAEVANRAAGHVDSSVRRGLTGVIEGQIRNCQEDLKFRRQYKIRGEAEKKLLELFIQLAEQQSDPTSQAFLKEFKPLVERIRTIPVPNCRRTGATLEKVLKKNGLSLPDQDTRGGDAIQPPSHKGHQQTGPDPGPTAGGHHVHAPPVVVAPSNPGGGRSEDHRGSGGGGSGDHGNPAPHGAAKVGEVLGQAGHIAEEVAADTGASVGQTTEQVGGAVDHAADKACEQAGLPVVCP